MNEENKYFDIEVIKRLQKGDNDAFDEVYQYYHKQVYYLAMQYFHDEEKAKDIVQDTFLTIHKYIHNLIAPEAFYVWMKKINYTCCVKKYTKEKKDSSFFSNDYESQEIEHMKFTNNATTVEDEVFYKDLKDAIIDILSNMDKDFRVVGYLRFFEELSTKEIAQILDIPMGTVSSRINRIKAKLKGELEKRGFSKEACFSAMLFPCMSQAYKVSIETAYPVEHLPFIKKKYKFNTSSKSQISKNILSNIAFVSCIVLPIGFVTLSNVQQGNHPSFIPNVIGTMKEASISDIQYKKGWSKDDLDIKVETSSNNYDEVMIDHQSNLRVSENKTYDVQLKKNGEIIDHQQIEITNIDKDSPSILNVEYDGNHTRITFEDKGSGIDYTSLHVRSITGQQVAYTLDEAHHMIEIHRSYKSAKLTLCDYVGNELDINIDFIEEAE